MDKSVYVRVNINQNIDTSIKNGSGFCLIKSPQCYKNEGSLNHTYCPSVYEHKCVLFTRYESMAVLNIQMARSFDILGSSGYDL